MIEEWIIQQFPQALALAVSIWFVRMGIKDRNEQREIDRQERDKDRAEWAKDREFLREWCLTQKPCPEQNGVID